MVNKLPKDLDSFIKKLQDFFLAKDFTEKEFKDQLKELGIVIIMASFSKLLQQKPPVQKLTSEKETLSYLKKNFTQEEIKEAVESESKKIGKEYLENVLGKI